MLASPLSSERTYQSSLHALHNTFLVNHTLVCTTSVSSPLQHLPLSLQPCPETTRVVKTETTWDVTYHMPETPLNQHIHSIHLHQIRVLLALKRFRHRWRKLARPQPLRQHVLQLAVRPQGVDRPPGEERLEVFGGKLGEVGHVSLCRTKINSRRGNKGVQIDGRGFEGTGD